jgi:hypothetical protein
MHMHTHVHTDTMVAVAGQQIVKQVCVVSLLLDHSGRLNEHKCIHTIHRHIQKAAIAYCFFDLKALGLIGLPIQSIVILQPALSLVFYHPFCSASSTIGVRLQVWILLVSNNIHILYICREN